MHLKVASFVGDASPCCSHTQIVKARRLANPSANLVYKGTSLQHYTVQASRDTAASAAADQMRRDQLALKQSKQLIPILAPASKGKPYKSPAAAHSTATAHANGTKTSALLNGGLPRKSSLESLGRMSSQVMTHVTLYQLFAFIIGTRKPCMHHMHFLAALLTCQVIACYMRGWIHCTLAQHDE